MTDGSEGDIERARALIAAAAVDLGCEKLDTGGKLSVPAAVLPEARGGAPGSYDVGE